MGMNWSTDGKVYDSRDEMLAADARYEQSKKQQELLQDQNRLIQQQAYQQRQLQYEQMNADRELELSRQSHAEKMRVLALFDDIGVNQQTFYNFADYLFGKHLSVQESQEINIIDEKIAVQEKELKLLNKPLEDLEKNKLVLEKLQRKISETEIINLKKNISDEKLNKSIVKFEKAEKKVKMWAGIALVVLFGGLGIINFIFIDYIEEAIWSLGVIFLPFIPFLGFLIKQSKAKKSISKTASEQLIEIEKQIKQQEKSDDNNEKKNLKEKINKLTVEKEAIINELQSDLDVKIQKRWKDFYKFRMNNYNSKVEKLLLDLNFPSEARKIGIEFESITKNNAKKNGDIEDYIAYFTDNKI